VVRISTITNKVQGEGLALLEAPLDNGGLASGPSDISLKVAQPFGAYIPHDSFTEEGCERMLLGVYSRLKGKYNYKFIPFPVIKGEPISPDTYSPLPPEVEKSFFLIYNFARYRLEELTNQVNRGPHSVEDVGRIEFYKGIAGDVRNTLTHYNSRLVIEMAKRTEIPHVDFPELVSEGNVALLKAVDKFDVGRGFKFSTYACRAILNDYKRMATRKGRYTQRFNAGNPDWELDDSTEAKRDGQIIDAIDNLTEILANNSAGLTQVEIDLINKKFFDLGVGGKERTWIEIGKDLGMHKDTARGKNKFALAKLKGTFREQYEMDSISN